MGGGQREGRGPFGIYAVTTLRCHNTSRLVATRIVAGTPGLYVPNVETVGLVRDERGWLRLTG